MHCYTGSANRSEAEVLPGTTRFKTYRSLSVEALHLGLRPTIYQLRCVSSPQDLPHSRFHSHRFPISVMGMITNPVMIARTILEGSYLEQALRQQMITVFIITTSNALLCVVATRLVLWACVNSEHHIRADCIDMRPHALVHAYRSAVDAIVGFLRGEVRI
jgi:hypothetical protein